MISGKIGIGATPLAAVDVNGDVQAHNFITISDANFKENVTEISSALDKVNQLRGVTYNFNLSI